MSEILDTQGLGLVPVHVQEQLRHVGGEGAENPGQHRVLVGGEDQAPHHRGQLLGRSPAQVLQLHVEAPGAAQPADRRNVEDRDVGRRNGGQPCADL